MTVLQFRQLVVALRAKITDAEDLQKLEQVVTSVATYQTVTSIDEESIEALADKYTGDDHAEG